MIWLQLDDRCRLVRDEILETERTDDVAGGRDDVCEMRESCAIDTRPSADRCRSDDDGTCADDRKFALQFRGRCCRVERHTDDASAKAREVGDHELDGVAAEQRESVAFADADLMQRAS